MRNHIAILRPLTSNLGDDLQSLALFKLLRSMGVGEICLIDREKISQNQCKHEHSLILNGWLLHNPLGFSLKPFKGNVLALGIHLTQREITRTSISAAKLVVDEFKSLEKVGCRDLATLDFLKSAGVPAYLSLCVSLTIDEFSGQRSNSVLSIDNSEFVNEVLLSKYEDSLVRRTNEIDISQSVSERDEKVEELLNSLGKAKLVVTSRLHVALPCLALGTPVILIEPKGESDGRFDVYHNFLTILKEKDLQRESIVNACNLVTTFSRTDHLPYVALIKKEIGEFLDKPSNVNTQFDYKKNLEQILELEISRQTSLINSYAGINKLIGSLIKLLISLKKFLS